MTTQNVNVVLGGMKGFVFTPSFRAESTPMSLNVICRDAQQGPTRAIFLPCVGLLGSSRSKTPTRVQFSAG